MGRRRVEAANLDDPLAMVATAAHELGHVRRLGHGWLSDEAADHEPLTDLLTVFLGRLLLAGQDDIFRVASRTDGPTMSAADGLVWRLANSLATGLAAHARPNARDAPQRAEVGGQAVAGSG
jgi:hypothetical protein